MPCKEQAIFNILTGNWPVGVSFNQIPSRRLRGSHLLTWTYTVRGFEASETDLAEGDPGTRSTMRRCTRNGTITSWQRHILRNPPIPGKRSMTLIRQVSTNQPNSTRKKVEPRRCGSSGQEAQFRFWEGIVDALQT